MSTSLIVGWLLLHGVGAALSLVVRRRDRAREPDRQRSGKLWRKYGSYLVITGGVLFIGSQDEMVFRWFVVFAAAAMLAELFGAVREAGRHVNPRVKTVGVVMIVVGAHAAIMMRQLDHNGDAFGWFWLVVATTDGYAQLFGQGFGSEKLAPRLSPDKTWAGFAGGTVAGIVAGVLLREVLAAPPLWAAAVTAAVTSVAATGGDLVESWMKRTLGIKDFSRVLGDHGGVLDRFDSALGAGPIAMILLRLLIP